MMVKYIFDYKEFVNAMKLVKEKGKPLGKPLSKNTCVAITKENDKLCSLKVSTFCHSIHAEIIGNGSIEISIIYLMKVLPTYIGLEKFTIETISNTQSVINGTFKVNTINSFPT